MAGNKMLVSTHAKTLTIAKAQTSEQLSLIKKERGLQVAELAIEKIFSEAILMLPHQLTNDQIILFSQMVVQEYWDLKIDDIILIFKNGIAGNYGKLYGNFHYSTFTEWVHEYLKAKEDYYIGINSRKFEPSAGERTGEQTIKQLLKK